MERKLNDKNFIAIADWMISDYDFNTRELLCYAIIYGFSQDGESKFSGSLSYLAQWLNISRRDNVLRYLNGLVEKGVITKEKVTGSTKTWCEYTALTNKGKTSKTDHIIISPWMIEDLNLKDKELILYALIYGFSRNGSSSFFTGNNAYMAKWLKVDKQHVTRYTSSLIKKGLIEKIEENNCIKYRVTDTFSINNNPNHFEYTLTNTEEINYNQDELESNQIEYTPNQNEYRGNQIEEEGITNLSTNNITSNNLDNNLNFITNNNTVVEQINQELLSFIDLSEGERNLLSEKMSNDSKILEKYKESKINIQKLMTSYASDYLRTQTIYYSTNGRSYFDIEENDPAKLAQELLLKTLHLKRYKNFIDNINNLSDKEVYSLFMEAYQLFEPDELNEKFVYKTKDAYFIGIVDNMLGM